jgi:putative transposase
MIQTEGVLGVGNYWGSVPPFSINLAVFSRMLYMRMPRMLREGARYHVFARANRKEMIFSSDEVKELFLTVLKEAKVKYDFRIENFCIMGNHVHFILRPGFGVSLSLIMKWLLGVFAIRFNKHFNMTGHVWGERFHSRIIESMREYLAIFVYIDENPVVARLVERIDDWLYGRFHLRERGCEWLLSSPAALADLP